MNQWRREQREMHRLAAADVLETGILDAVIAAVRDLYPGSIPDDAEAYARASLRRVHEN